MIGIAFEDEVEMTTGEYFERQSLRIKEKNRIARDDELDK